MLIIMRDLMYEIGTGKLKGEINVIIDALRGNSKDGKGVQKIELNYEELKRGALLTVYCGEKIVYRSAYGDVEKDYAKNVFNSFVDLVR